MHLGDAQTHSMDFIMISKKLETILVQVLDSDWFTTDHMAGTCCLLVESENEILCETWSDFSWLEARRLQREAAETLTDWKIGM